MIDYISKLAKYYFPLLAANEIPLEQVPSKTILPLIQQYIDYLNFLKDYEPEEKISINEVIRELERIGTVVPDQNGQLN